MWPHHGMWWWRGRMELLSRSGRFSREPQPSWTAKITFIFLWVLLYVEIWGWVHKIENKKRRQRIFSLVPKCSTKALRRLSWYSLWTWSHMNQWKQAMSFGQLVRNPQWITPCIKGDGDSGVTNPHFLNRLLHPATCWREDLRGVTAASPSQSWGPASSSPLQQALEFLLPGVYRIPMQISHGPTGFMWALDYYSVPSWIVCCMRCCVSAQTVGRRYNSHRLKTCCLVFHVSCNSRLVFFINFNVKILFHIF